MNGATNEDSRIAQWGLSGSLNKYTFFTILRLNK